MTRRSCSNATTRIFRPSGADRSEAVQGNGGNRSVPGGDMLLSPQRRSPTRRVCEHIGGSGTDDLCDLWLNPARTTFDAAKPPPASVAGVGAGGTDLAQIDRFFFRSGGSSSSPAKLVADELRVGRAWADVTP